ncbi:polysaccharide biosynthesis protein, partial [Citrobacter portucalensis]|uniref:lipopolysaccharide biosynthesis protein n=1 Tax=Citrobacter portucalensis TaxID=1639133 RepID=UPI00226B29CB
MKKEILILVICRTFQILIGLLSLRIMTGLFSTEQMGEYYIFLTLFMLATLSVINPFGQYINRNTYKWKKIGILTLWLRRYIGFVTLFSLLFSSAYFAWVVFTTNELILTPAVLCFLYIAIISANQFFLYTLNILNSRLIFSILTVLTAFLSLCIAFCLFQLSAFGNSSKVYSWILGVVIANFVSFFAAFFFLTKNGNNKIGKLYSNVNFKEIVNFCIPISITTFLMWVISAGYRFGIEPLMGLNYLGVISVCFAISSQVMSVIESLVTQIFQPNLFKTMDEVSRPERGKLLEGYVNENIAIYLSTLIFSSFFMHEIFLVLVDNKYLPYFYIGIIAILSEFFRISTNSLAMYFFCEKDMKRGILPFLCGAIFIVLMFSIFNLYDVKNHLFIIIPLGIAFSNFICFLSCLVAIRKYGSFNFNMI